MRSEPNVPLTTRIKLKDKQGRVIGEKEVATYAGLLARAHEEGLSEIQTGLTQVPCEDNGFVCIAKADVKTKKGTFSGIGDASPRNVNTMIVPHLIRMAETRAKARALRDAVNIGLVALEELGGDGGEGLDQPDEDRDRPPSSGNSNGRPRNGGGHRPDEPMTESQRRFLYRLLAGAGIEADAATTVIIEEAGTNSIASISKQEASWLIERFRNRYEQEAHHGA